MDLNNANSPHVECKLVAQIQDRRDRPARRVRIAVSVGHGPDDPGAGSTWLEHLEAYKVAGFCGIS
jgi:hypothetical protein